MEHMDRKIIPMLYGKTLNGEPHQGTETRDVEASPESREVKPFEPITMIHLEQETIHLRRTELYEGKVTVSLPRTFRLVTEREAQLKYPSSHRPEWIYTNDSGTVNFTFKTLDHRLAPEELNSFTESMADVIRATQPVREWKKHGVRVTDAGLSTGYCQFAVQGLNDQIYNHMVFTILNQKVLVYGFNCTEDEKKNWMEPGGTLLDTLIVEMN